MTYDVITPKCEISRLIHTLKPSGLNTASKSGPCRITGSREDIFLFLSVLWGQPGISGNAATDLKLIRDIRSCPPEYRVTTEIRLLLHEEP